MPKALSYPAGRHVERSSSRSLEEGSEGRVVASVSTLKANAYRGFSFWQLR